MHRYIALLRGVNVGRANRISMADLRAAVEALGYTHVRTLLNSGNVIFAGPSDARGTAEESIGSALSRIGVRTRVFVLHTDELRAILASHPFPAVATDPARLLIAVLSGGRVSAPLATVAAAGWGSERCAIVGGAAYLWCANGILESPLLKAFSRAAGDGATTRNWSTMTKLAD